MQLLAGTVISRENMMTEFYLGVFSRFFEMVQKIPDRKIIMVCTLIQVFAIFVQRFTVAINNNAYYNEPT